ncbi:MAG: hypothetical protein CSA62_09700 [Planctomycetota bacterium]|nr:MAG: hypothetical protein CSA62_09700 [Planctomycetota bacterium]
MPITLPIAPFFAPTLTVAALLFPALSAHVSGHAVAQGLDLPGARSGQSPDDPPPLEIPTSKKKKEAVGRPGLRLPSGASQGQQKRGAKSRMRRRSPKDLFLESLRSKEELTREELIAEYQLLSDLEKAQLLRNAGSLPAASLGRLSTVYAYLPEKTALGVLLRALRKRSLGKATAIIANNAVHLAKGRSKQLAFDFLASRRRLVREAGESILLREISDGDLSQLRQLFDSSASGTRLSAMQVLGEYVRRNPEAPLDRLLRALDAKDGSLRRTAAEILGSLEGERVLPALKKRVTQAPSPRSGQHGLLLASLLLSQLELARGETLLPEPAQPYLSAARKGATPLERAVGAIVAGTHCFMAPPQEDAAQTAARVQFKGLVEELLAVIQVNAFYQELPLCHDQALVILRLLSGEDFGNDYLRWGLWWREAKDGFQPFSRALRLTPELVETAVLRHAFRGTVQHSILGPRAEEAEGDGVRFRLSAQAFSELVQAMRKRGFLDLKARLMANRLQSEQVTLTLLSFKGRVQDAFYGDADLRLRAVAGVLSEIFQRESWQEFAPKSLSAEQRRDWWRQQDAAIAAIEDPRKRTSYVLGLCASVLGELEEGARRRALGLLLEEASREDSGLGLQHAESLLKLLQNPKNLPPLQRRTVFEVLAQIKEPGVFAKLLAALRHQPVGEIQVTLARVLALAGPQHIRAALQDEDSIVRAAAAAEMHNLRDTKLYPLLIQLLDDESELVRRRAIQSVGRLGLQEALPKLAKIVEADDDDLRHAALVALGGLGGPKAFDLLFKATTRESTADKLAAVRGLTLLRDKRTGGALLLIATSHYPQPLGMTALAGLAKRGGPALRGKIRDAFFQTNDRELKRELVFALASMGEPEVFKPLLDRLASTGRYRQRTLIYLAGISGIDWVRERDAVARYQRWFASEGTKRPRDWFLAALARLGIPTDLKSEQLMPGASPEVIDELAAYLESAKSWPLRMQANYLLREITRQDYGSIAPQTTLGERQAIGDRFRAFARAQADR